MNGENTNNFLKFKLVKGFFICQYHLLDVLFFTKAIHKVGNQLLYSIIFP